MGWIAKTILPVTADELADFKYVFFEWANMVHRTLLLQYCRGKPRDPWIAVDPANPHWMELSVSTVHFDEPAPHEDVSCNILSFPKKLPDGSARVL